MISLGKSPTIDVLIGSGFDSGLATTALPQSPTMVGVVQSPSISGYTRRAAS